MKTATEISVYGHFGNHAVVRLPGRRYPGLILQADTVSGFISQLAGAQAALRAGKPQRADAELHLLIETLEHWYAQIEQRLAAAGEQME